MEITTRTLLAAVAAPLAKTLVARLWTAVPLPAGTDGAGGGSRWVAEATVRVFRPCC